MKDGRVKLKNEVLETMAKLRSLVSALVYEDVARESIPEICQAAIKKLAPALGTTPERICMRSNAPDIVLPRQICQYVMRESLHVTLSDVALATGLSDLYSTVAYSCNKVEKMRHANPDFDKKVRQLCGLLLNRNCARKEVI